MASLSKTKSGARFIQFSRPDGTRPRIWLGTGITQKEAGAILIHVEALVRSRRFGTALPDGVTKWLSTLPDELKQKLADVALIDFEEASPLSFLGPFLVQYKEARRKTHKPASLVVWDHTIKNIVHHFGADRPIDRITHADAEAFYSYLLDSGLNPTTVSKRIQHSRMFFSHARRCKLIADNPFEFIRARGGDMTAKRCYIPASDIDLVIDAAPNAHWRLLIALARHAGLRTPSEPFSLRWSDVDWDKGRIVITSPKTEHHHGGGRRTIPLFPSVRPYLEECWDLAEEGGDDFIFPQEWRQRAHGPNGWINANLRTTFMKIIRRAGLEPWKRPFHNLRASCETDLAAKHPIHVVTKWIGNTVDIALQHYLTTTDADFQKALGDPVDVSEPAKKTT